jgi:hypothetical protein
MPWQSRQLRTTAVCTRIGSAPGSLWQAVQPKVESGFEARLTSSA